MKYKISANIHPFDEAVAGRDDSSTADSSRSPPSVPALFQAVSPSGWWCGWSSASQVRHRRARTCACATRLP